MKIRPTKEKSSLNINRRLFLRNSSLTLAGIAALKFKAFAKIAEQAGLKDLYQDDFLIGTAINAWTFIRKDEELLNIIRREFNSITAANAFKWGVIHPKDDEWKFEIPDRFVEFGMENNMHMLGHVLVWHSQAPRKLFEDESGNPISKAALKKKMENHILTLVDKYKGKIETWDVVNESITPEDKWRKTKWLEIIGPEFMDYAFNLAHEANPNAHLLYNDYNMDNPKRREYVVDFIRHCKKSSIPIHGIGMQGHLNLDSPNFKDLEESIVAFANEGMQVHFTELDVDVLPYNWGRTAEVSTNQEYRESLNPYKDGLTKEVEDRFTKYYEDLFRLFLKHRDKIARVTFWGTSDDQSWKNNFPMRGRTNYPLLFDRQRQPKDAYWAVANLKK